MKRIIAILLAVCFIFAAVGCAETQTSVNPPVEDDSIAAMVASMSLTQKASQMVQGEDPYISSVSDDLKLCPLGSVLSGGGTLSNSVWSPNQWKTLVDSYQDDLLETDGAIPLIYGIDAVHGNNKVKGAVVFPHNIGIGAANDPELTRQMGAAVAEEMKLCGILLDFAPCVAVVDDPRWGRTYESYSSDTAIVTSLATAFSEGMLERGVMPTAKHYLGDGNTTFGTSPSSKMLDRGDTRLSEEEIRERLLPPYKALVDAGVKVVMPSFSSIDGIKMHENDYYINTVLKGELGFDGFVISDWEGATDLSYGPLITCVSASINAGVDMLMQPSNYLDTVQAIVKAVNRGLITEERIDDAVTRILTVKKEMGILDDPYQKNLTHEVDKVGSDGYRELAQKLVQKSLVLLKNENDALPLKPGTTVFVTGTAADDPGLLCGGWTGSWQGQPGDSIPGFTILDGLEECAEEYDLTIITDEARIDEADVVLAVLGEKPYAESDGDSFAIGLTGGTAHGSNKGAIELAKQSGKPTITMISAGRNVMISDYIDQWDAVIMCYLPGTEAGASAANLVGAVPFTGKLPMPWYATVDDIGADEPNLLFEMGFGLES